MKWSKESHGNGTRWGIWNVAQPGLCWRSRWNRRSAVVSVIIGARHDKKIDSAAAVIQYSMYQSRALKLYSPSSTNAHRRIANDCPSCLVTTGRVKFEGGLLRILPYLLHIHL